MRFLKALTLVAACLVPTCAWAQGAWPAGPIKFVVPYPPSTSGDLVARKLAPLIGQAIGGTVVIENRGGANGNIGMELVASAPADGHTFIVGSDIQFAVAPALYSKLPYDVDKGFTTVGPMARVELVLMANPSLNVSSVKELIDLAKSKKREISYGSTGVGSTHQLFTELFKMRGGFDMLHIPYKGSGQAIPDLLAGQIQVMFMGVTQSLPHIASGKLKPLAVGALSRLPQVPDIPTMSESGFANFEAYNYWGLWAPSGTPQPIILRMQEALSRALDNPDLKAWYDSSVLTVLAGGANALDQNVKRDRARWAEVIKANKIEVNE
jgi:tripartite-type tricarboxylate transporter receptor subunit TctC